MRFDLRSSSTFSTIRVLAWPIKTPWNPYTGLVYSNLPADVKVDGWPGNLLRKYSIWHVHWPDSLLNIPNAAHAACKVSGMFATMDYLRFRGARIIWTMHNLASHEARHPRLEAWFWKRLIPCVDGAISLSSAGLAMAFERFPPLRGVPTTIIPHGHYRDQYPETTSDAREVLGIAGNAKVILFFGAVRAYKNVSLLIRAFRGLQSKEAVLYVVGNPNSSELADQIKREASRDQRVSLKFEFVRAKDVSTYLRAADLVVLPYREVLNSGSALLALSWNRPVLVPDQGAMGELKADFSDSWVRTYRGPLNESILGDALQWAFQRRQSSCSMPNRYDWTHIGMETVQFYERVLSGASAESDQPEHFATCD